MNAEKLANLHPRRERVTVFWPGGPHHFEILFHEARPWGPTEGPWADWFLINGLVVSPGGVENRYVRSFYVHPIAGGYALVPHSDAVPYVGEPAA